MIVRFPDGTERSIRYGSNCVGIAHRGFRPVYIEYTDAEVQQAFPHPLDKKAQIRYHVTNVLAMLKALHIGTYITEYDPKTGIHSIEVSDKNIKDILDEQRSDKDTAERCKTIA